MRAGKLRSRITIRRIVDGAQNSFGEPTVKYSDVGVYWADIRAMQGRELEAAQQTWAEARFKITIRDVGQNIRRKDVVIWGSRTLDIIDVEDPDQRNRKLVMVCKEFVQ